MKDDWLATYIEAYEYLARVAEASAHTAKEEDKGTVSKDELNCLKCHYRHKDNGNCTAVGGFCTAVPAAHCPLIPELFALLEAEKANAEPASKCKPLTLKELRKMVGKPVWVETERRKEWYILWGYHGPEVIGRAMIFTPRTAAKIQLLFADYMKTWAAFAAEPPSLDREAWKRCPDCEEIFYFDKRCDNCKYEDFFASQAPCEHCESKSEWKPYYSFCPTCGRPLTDAAWELLERRLAGREI